MAQLHIVLLPMIAHGHMIPMVDMAKLFISRGIKVTIITTPAFADSITRARKSGIDIGISLINFPPEGSDLPHDMVSLDQMRSPDQFPEFFKAFDLLQEPVEKLLQELSPNALISDLFLHWTADSAAKFGIPRIVFNGISYFALCVTEQMERHKPRLEYDGDEFVIPNLPHKITLVKSQFSPFTLGDQEETVISKMFTKMSEASMRSYGVVVNSFYELEQDYADHYRNFLERKAWHIGPLLLLNKGGVEEMVLRGKKSAIEGHECLSWLDSKRPNSVVYMCFGSMASFTPAQLHETAVGLEASGQDFIWVVGGTATENEDWLPEGFEARTKGKGLIIRGWAPQVLILDHKAIGAFVTHCGWNSTLEGICAGLPMVTWPSFAEQFYNEKLVTEVLQTGVSVGNKKWTHAGSEGVTSDAVAKAVRDVVVGDEAAKMRKRAEMYKEIARKAIEEGGSSYKSLDNMVEDLRAYSQHK